MLERTIYSKCKTWGNNAKTHINSRWIELSGKSRFYLAITISSFTVLLEKIANQQSQHPYLQGQGLQMLCSVECPVPPSVLLQAFKELWWVSIIFFSACTAAKPSISNPIPGSCSRKQVLLVRITLQITPVFWLPWPSHAMQDEDHQPRQAVREGLMPPSLAPHLHMHGAAESPGSSSLFHTTRVYSPSSTLSLWHIVAILCWIANALSLITIGQLIEI